MTLEVHYPRPHKPHGARRAPGASIRPGRRGSRRDRARATGSTQTRIPAHPVTPSCPTGKAEPAAPAPPRPGEGKGAAAAAAHPPPRWIRPGSLRKNSPQHHCAQQFPIASCWEQLLLPPGGLRPPRPSGGAAADPREQRAGTASWLRRGGRCSPRTSGGTAPGTGIIGHISPPLRRDRPSPAESRPKTGFPRGRGRWDRLTAARGEKEEDVPGHPVGRRRKHRRVIAV